MSSGFGFKDREGRCYQFWKSVEQCSVRYLFTSDGEKPPELRSAANLHETQITTPWTAKCP
ncbi:hypothetical protein P3T76_012663 [Phytophthora citrophthora]|uniref:Uncharacterized protein n=1 Tax=Phytophthora citrophthora TaxID=4793 RepID=A0AAD9LCT5_9STRA|nr:hypothetical protein P3T76_012663 [Phytophthora citrophthora]